MATLETIYLGDLRTEITHLQSGEKVITDAPLDNNGKGQFISPTDMVAGALGSCMLTLMALAANRLGLDMRGTRLTTTKIMASDPRRISEIIIEFDLPFDCDGKSKKILERSADTCPVAKSLHPDLKQTMIFHYKRD